MTFINRTHKDRLFRLLFADEKNKENTLALYNALNNSSYEDTKDLEITTLEDVIYIRMKNDLSFIIADSMNLYEQQSSHNPNMPLRGFLYFSHLYEKYLTSHALSLHVNRLVKIPTPNYIVFYNGVALRPAVEKLRLSDAFQTPDNRKEFEWTSTVINLNHPENAELLKKCRPLSDYTLFVSRIQTYQKTMSIEDAVNRAVRECITSGILTAFLTAHRAEVLQLYLAEVNEDVLRKNLKEEGRAEGREEGRAEGRTEKLTELIVRKLEKGKSLSVIAAELEEEEEAIRPIYEKLKLEIK